MFLLDGTWLAFSHNRTSVLPTGWDLRVGLCDGQKGRKGLERRRVGGLRPGRLVWEEEVFSLEESGLSA